MAIRYYDDLLVEKLKRWMPEESKMRVLGPDETTKLFQIKADESKDKPISLPMITLSRKPDIELLSTVKSPRSFDGLRLVQQGDAPQNMTNLRGEALTNAINAIPTGSYQFNVLPIRPEYQIDIYTKYAEECEEYVRALLFKLINNPVIKIEIPYQNLQIEHIANIRVLSNVSNTSGITERIFSGQFTRWSIQLELHDAFLFSIPYRKNWTFSLDGDTIADLELSESIDSSGIIEAIY